MNIISAKFRLSVLFITATFLATISYAIDTIDTSHILTDNGTTLVSSDETFELGFFNASNSNNRYVGIWYRRISPGTVVWTANRDNPLTDSSGTLRLVAPGRLVLVNGTNGTIWSTNATRNLQNPIAQLLDSGNLVVRDANDDNPENYVWQSFDYPTDTFLPGMKLGVNFTTGQEVKITSRKNSDDVSSGDYTYSCEPTGFPQNVIRRGTEVTYRTGPWNGITFSGSPNLQNDPIFTFRLVFSREAAYYHYEVRNDSIFSRFTISSTGLGERWLWRDQTQDWSIYLTIPIDSCDDYNKCGPYSSCNTGDSPVCSCLEKFEPKDAEAWGRGDWSSGCIRSTPLNCTTGDGFLKYSPVKLPDARVSRFNNTMNLEECRVLCFNNCSCTAYSSLNISEGENGCLFWFGDLDDMQETPTGQDIYIRMASSELGSKGRRRTILIVTLSLVIGALMLSVMLFLYFRKRKQINQQLEERDTSRLNNAANHHPDELPLYDLSTIIKATGNFSVKNKIGKGGFGTVYKGILEDGQEIAVKRLSKTSHQGLDEFKNEVICIAKLQHRNLVKLLGWCTEGEEMMLLYEYMPNKSLNLSLFDPTKSTLLDWPTRFNIINGVARGLMYLHQDSRLRIIHRDLKTSNILLDSDMNPRISDFGLARTFGGNESGGGTSRIVGTYGYMSPEYVVDGLFSVKSDVFSYGVVVLEIVSGRKNRGFKHTDHRLNLLGHAWMLYTEGRSLEFIDSCLINSSNLSQALRSIHVGLLCVQENPDDRPSMSLVVMMLTNDGVLPQPKRPGFFTARQMQTNEISVSSNTDTSRNIMSITQLDAR